jgi:orotidine-5'-phosphate decarboxylase
MTIKGSTMSTPLSAHERILIALDVDSADAAVALARKVAGTVGGLKVGLELISATFGW